MTNPFYSASGNPANRSPGSSAAIRAEFLLLQGAFDKLPTFSGNAGRPMVVNGAEDAFVAATALNNIPIGNLDPDTGTFTTLVANTYATQLVLRSGVDPWFNIKSTVDASSYGAFAKADGTVIGYMGGGAGAAVSAGSTSDFALRAAAGKLYLSATGNLDVTVSTVEGRVGIGTASPVCALDIVGAGSSTAVGKLSPSGPTNAAVWQFSNSGGDFYVGRDNSGGGVFGSSYSVAIWNNSAHPIRFGTSGTYRGMMGSDGTFGWNTAGFSASNLNGVTLEPYAGGTFQTVGHNTSAANGDSYISFLRNGVTLGSITQVSSTGVAFNTTSDRRLKKKIEPAPGATSIVEAIGVVQHDWVHGEQHTDFGVIAQDLHEVFPDAVTVGDVERPWQVDYSRLVPLVIKALQEAMARIRVLELGAAG